MQGKRKGRGSVAAGEEREVEDLREAKEGRGSVTAGEEREIRDLREAKKGRESVAVGEGGKQGMLGKGKRR